MCVLSVVVVVLVVVIVIVIVFVDDITICHTLYNRSHCQTTYVPRIAWDLSSVVIYTKVYTVRSTIFGSVIYRLYSGCAICTFIPPPKNCSHMLFHACFCFMCYIHARPSSRGDVPLVCFSLLLNVGEPAIGQGSGYAGCTLRGVLVRGRKRVRSVILQRFEGLQGFGSGSAGLLPGGKTAGPNRTKHTQKTLPYNILLKIPASRLVAAMRCHPS